MWGYKISWRFFLSLRRSTYPLLLWSELYKQCKLPKMFVVKAIMSAIFHSGTFSLFPGKCLHVLPVYHLMLYTINNTNIRHMKKVQILLNCPNRCFLKCWKSWTSLLILLKSVFCSISYKQSSIWKETRAEYLKSLFHPMAFQTVISLAWNFSLMFDLTSNWKYQFEGRQPFTRARIMQILFE